MFEDVNMINIKAILNWSNDVINCCLEVEFFKSVEKVSDEK